MFRKTNRVIVKPLQYTHRHRLPPKMTMNGTSNSRHDVTQECLLMSFRLYSLYINMKTPTLILPGQLCLFVYCLSYVFFWVQHHHDNNVSWTLAAYFSDLYCTAIATTNTSRQLINTGKLSSPFIQASVIHYDVHVLWSMST